MNLNPKERLARDLFFQTGKTQKEIAAIIGVSEKTIYLWMTAGDWKRLRSASKAMPSLIVENFYAQVQELNDDIRSRGAGKRFPTMQEAEVFRKMVMTIGRIQKGHTQPEYMEMMQKFLTWMMSEDQSLAASLTPIADKFLKSRSVDGFLPFDIEHEPEPPKDQPGTIDFLAAEFTNNTSLSFGEGRGEAKQDDNHTSSPEHVPQHAGERPGEVSAPPLFLGEAGPELASGVPAGGRGPLSPNTPEDNNPTSLSGACPATRGGEGRAEAKQETTRTFLLVTNEKDKQETTRTPLLVTDEKDKQETTRTPLLVTDEKDKQETTRNETKTPYDSSHAASLEPHHQKPAMQIEPEIGNEGINNISSPSERSGEVAPSPITYHDINGDLKLIPPYKSDEYYALPRRYRERLYTIGGSPIKNRRLDRYV